MIRVILEVPVFQRSRRALGVFVCVYGCVCVVDVAGVDFGVCDCGGRIRRRIQA